MVIGWIAGGVGCVGLLLTAWAWRGRACDGRSCRRCRYDRSGDTATRCPECGTDRAPVPRRRRRWITLGIGVLVAAIGGSGVLVPTVRNTPLLNVMPTDVLITGAPLIPRSWLVESISMADRFMGRTDGYALNRRTLSESQKRRLTSRVDTMLARQTSIEDFGMLGHARPRWDAKGVPLDTAARLTLLRLFAERWEADPTYDVTQQAAVFQGLDNVSAGFGTVASGGFRDPTVDEAAIVNRFIAAAASVSIEDDAVGSVPAAMSATWMQLLGPWFPAGTPTLLRWADEQSFDFSKRSQRASAAIAMLTEAGAWNEQYRATAIELMHSDKDAVAFAACLLRIHEDDLAQAYRPTLTDIVKTDERTNVAMAAASSLVQMGAFAQDVYEIIKARAMTAEDNGDRGALYRSAMRFPADIVRPDVDLYLNVTAEADVELQRQLVGSLMYLHRTFEETEPDTAARILESANQYLDSNDEDVRRSAFWVE